MWGRLAQFITQWNSVPLQNPRPQNLHNLKYVWLQHTSKPPSIFPIQRGFSSHCHWKFPKIESNLNLPHIAHAAWTQIEKSDSHKLCEDNPVPLPAPILLCLKQRGSRCLLQGWWWDSHKLTLHSQKHSQHPGKAASPPPTVVIVTAVAATARRGQWISRIIKGHPRASWKPRITATG